MAQVILGAQLSQRLEPHDINESQLSEAWRTRGTRSLPLTTTIPVMFNKASHLNVGDVTQINAHGFNRSGSVNVSGES